MISVTAVLPFSSELNSLQTILHDDDIPTSNFCFKVK